MNIQVKSIKGRFQARNEENVETEGLLENVLRERQWYEETYHKKNPERYPQLPSLPIVLKRGKSTVRVTKSWIGNNIRKANGYIYSIR